MRMFRPWLLAAAVLLAVPATHAQQVTVAGVTYHDSVDLHGTKLHLNGAGIRYKFVVKVYTAGLYLPTKATTAQEALAMQGAKKISVTMLRDIDSGELGKLFARAVEDNMDRASFSQIIPGLVRMSQLFSDVKQLKSGDNFTIDWIPGTGTVISLKGQPLGEPFKEPEFFNALLRIWLGPSPADWKLKDALLGKSAA